METSLRYDGQTKSLRIHAKERFSLSPDAFFQVHGELDTYYFDRSRCKAIIRHMSPWMSLGVGLQYNKRDKFRYRVHGKKEFPLTDDGLLSLKVKAAGDSDTDFGEKNGKAAAELILTKLNFRVDQDIRLKVGYEMSEQVSYAQIREDNWTFNLDNKGRWNLRFDL
ncbi:hypothetical protein Scep_000077 [Stephania cephalantha]|uniref:Uncharacterized protein n=1 Tax=Stephania cephalantha TaxID=152367 RepID=A0AAP0L5P4_9MAGN